MALYDVYLIRFGPAVSDPAAALRTVFPVDAKTAQAIVRGLPKVVKRDAPRDAAQTIAKALRDIGAEAECRPSERKATSLGIGPSTPAAGSVASIPAPGAQHASRKRAMRSTAMAGSFDPDALLQAVESAKKPRAKAPVAKARAKTELQAPIVRPSSRPPGAKGPALSALVSRSRPPARKSPSQAPVPGDVSDSELAVPLTEEEMQAIEKAKRSFPPAAKSQPPAAKSQPPTSQPPVARPSSEPPASSSNHSDLGALLDGLDDDDEPAVDSDPAGRAVPSTAPPAKGSGPPPAFELELDFGGAMPRSKPYSKRPFKSGAPGKSGKPGSSAPAKSAPSGTSAAAVAAGAAMAGLATFDSSPPELDNDGLSFDLDSIPAPARTGAPRVGSSPASAPAASGSAHPLAPMKPPVGSQAPTALVGGESTATTSDRRDWVFAAVTLGVIALMMAYRFIGYTPPPKPVVVENDLALEQRVDRGELVDAKAFIEGGGELISANLSKMNLRAFVDDLYEAGAVQVWAEPDQPLKGLSKGGLMIAVSLIVELPDDDDALDALTTAYALWLGRPGDPVGVDQLETHGLGDGYWRMRVDVERM